MHIPTYPRLVSTAAMHGSREPCRQTNRPTNRPTDQLTNYNNPSLRMRMRGLIIVCIYTYEYVATCACAGGVSDVVGERVAASSSVPSACGLELPDLPALPLSPPCSYLSSQLRAGREKKIRSMSSCTFICICSLFDLACFFLPSFSSLIKNMLYRVCIHIYLCACKCIIIMCAYVSVCVCVRACVCMSVIKTRSLHT